jgi:hypothetical protein
MKPRFTYTAGGHEAAHCVKYYITINMDHIAIHYSYFVHGRAVSYIERYDVLVSLSVACTEKYVF